MQIVKQAIDATTAKVMVGMELDAQKQPKGNVELDIESQSQFVEVLNTAFDDGIVHIILDMQNINYIDSSGLWALFETHKKATQKQGRLVLINPTKDVKRVLDITKMSSKIQILGSEAEAVEAVKKAIS